MNSYHYNAHADDCGVDNSTFNDVRDNLKGYTHVILLIDFLGNREKYEFAFKAGCIAGKFKKENVNLYFLNAPNEDMGRFICDLNYYCIRKTNNRYDVAEEIWYEFFERRQAKCANAKIARKAPVEQEIYIRALRFCVRTNRASVSLIQRQFPVGYCKACRIFDWMADNRYIFAQPDKQHAKVLLTYREFKKLYGETDND